MVEWEQWGRVIVVEEEVSVAADECEEDDRVGRRGMGRYFLAMGVGRRRG